MAKELVLGYDMMDICGAPAAAKMLDGLDVCLADHGKASCQMIV